MKRLWIDIKWMVYDAPTEFATVVLSFITAVGVIWMLIRCWHCL